MRPVLLSLPARRGSPWAGVLPILAFLVLSLLCFNPILWALLSEPRTGVHRRRAIPLGAVEGLRGAAEEATPA
ncbi:hypothetical protein [Actinoplanes sp. NPDC048796]|uniref:hypothetical protein n=1 Tax=Actinoplanes sp. NPDC048796 TaxID=3155640 RepID=UPI0033D6069E